MFIMIVADRTFGSFIGLHSGNGKICGHSSQRWVYCFFGVCLDLVLAHLLDDDVSDAEAVCQHQGNTCPKVADACQHHGWGNLAQTRGRQN